MVTIARGIMTFPPSIDAVNTASKRPQIFARFPGESATAGIFANPRKFPKQPVVPGSSFAAGMPICHIGAAPSCARWVIVMVGLAPARSEKNDTRLSAGKSTTRGTYFLMQRRQRLAFWCSSAVPGKGDAGREWGWLESERTKMGYYWWEWNLKFDESVGKSSRKVLE